MNQKTAVADPASTSSTLLTATTGAAKPKENNVFDEPLQCCSSMHPVPESPLAAPTRPCNTGTSNASPSIGPVNNSGSIRMPTPAYYIHNFQPVPPAGFVQPVYNPYQQRVLIRPMDSRGNVVYHFLPTGGESTPGQLIFSGNAADASSTSRRPKSGKDKKTNAARGTNSNETNESLKAAIAKQRRLITQLVKIIVNDKLGNEAFTSDEGKEAFDFIEQQRRAARNKMNVTNQLAENTTESKMDLRSEGYIGVKSHSFACKDENADCTFGEYFSSSKEASTSGQHITVDVMKNVSKKVGKGRGRSRPTVADRKLAELGRKTVDLLSPTKKSVLHNLREEFSRQLESLKQMMEQDKTTRDIENATSETTELVSGAYPEPAATPREDNQQADAYLSDCGVPNECDPKGTCSAERDIVTIQDDDEFPSGSNDENQANGDSAFSTPISTSKQTQSANPTASIGKGKRKKKIDDCSYAAARLQEDDIVETECRRSPRKRSKTTAPSGFVRRSASKQATKKISNLLKGSDKESTVSDVAPDCETNEDETKAHRMLLPPEFDPVLECADNVELEMEKEQNVSKMDNEKLGNAPRTDFSIAGDGRQPGAECYGGCSPDIVDDTCLDYTVEWSAPRSVSSATSLPILRDSSPACPARVPCAEYRRELEISPLGFNQPLDLTSQAIMKSSTFFTQAAEFQTQALDLRMTSKQPFADGVMHADCVTPTEQSNSSFRPITTAKTLADVSADASVATRESFACVNPTCDGDSVLQSCALNESPASVDPSGQNSEIARAVNDECCPQATTTRFENTHGSDHVDGSNEAWEPRTDAIFDLSKYPTFSHLDFSRASSPQSNLKDWLSRRRKFPNSLFSFARGHGIGFLRRNRVSSQTSAGSTVDALRKVNKAKSIWKTIADAGRLGACVAPNKRGRRRKIYRDRAVLTLADTPPIIVSSSGDYETPEEAAAEKKMKKLKKRRDYKSSRLIKKTSKESKWRKSANEFPFVAARQTTESSEVEVISESSYSLCKSNDDAVGATSLTLPSREEETLDSSEILLKERMLKLQENFANSDRDDDFQPGELGRLNSVFSQIRAQIGKVRICRREREPFDLTGKPTRETGLPKKAENWKNVGQALSETEQSVTTEGTRKNASPLEIAIKKEIDLDDAGPFPFQNGYGDYVKTEDAGSDLADSLSTPRNQASGCVVNISPLKYRRSGTKWVPGKKSESPGRSPLRKTFVRNKNSYSVRDTTDEEIRSNQGSETKGERRETDSEESDVSSKSSEVSIAEWTMVPRRACSEAKKKISRMVQLTGATGKKAKKPPKVVSSGSRQSSLRKKQNTP